MTWLGWLLLLAALPHEPPRVVDRVDVVEVNHTQCPQTGREVLCQVIYWRWHPADCTHHVAAWRMAKPSDRFRRDGREWIEAREDGPIRREIRAVQFRETWTFEDPELLDREAFSKDLRRGLRPATIEK